MGRPHKCPYCSGIATTWKGYRTVKTGKVRLRRCRDCGRKWTTKNMITTKDETSVASGVQAVAPALFQEQPSTDGDDLS